MNSIRQVIRQAGQIESDRFVLLDRDGVLNIDRPDYVKSLAECQEVPGAGAAIAMLNKLGFRVLVVSNQACIERGIVSAALVRQINQQLADSVRASGGLIEAFYVCPHAPESRCACRKPAAGLIDQAQGDYGFQASVTALVGDSRRDTEAAIAAGCKPVLVASGKPLDWKPLQAVETHINLLAYAHSVCRQETLSNAL